MKKALLFMTSIMLVGAIFAAMLPASGAARNDVPFYDVDYSNPYYAAIEYARVNNIAGGYTDGSFHPYSNISRAEFVTMLIKAKRINPSAYTYSNCFYDVAKQWFANEVCYASEQGWVSSTDTYFYPSRAMTYNEAVSLINHAFNTTPYSVPTTYVTRAMATDMFYSTLGNGTTTYAAYTSDATRMEYAPFDAPFYTPRAPETYRPRVRVVETGYTRQPTVVFQYRVEQVVPTTPAPVVQVVPVITQPEVRTGDPVYPQAGTGTYYDVSRNCAYTNVCTNYVWGASLPAGY